jgi:PAS domain S-box-containing protein
VDIPILILGQDRRIRRFTPPAEKLLRLLPGDVGRPIGDLRIGISIPDMDGLITTVIENNDQVRREVQGEVDGHWYMLSVRPFRTSEKRIEGALLAFVDIQDLKQQQEALARERDLTAAILESARDLLVVVLSPDGRIVHFNQVCQSLTGYSLEEAKNQVVWDFLVDPADSAQVKQCVQKVARGETCQSTNHWLTKDGRQRQIEWMNTPSRSDGDVEYVIRTGVDVTGREEAQDRAREGEATVRALLEAASQAILAVDRQGLIVLTNDAAEKMFGYPRQEMVGHPVGRLIPGPAAEKHATHIAQWFSNPVQRPMGGGRELRGRRKNGSEFPAEIMLNSVETRAGMLAVTFISDITERKKNEAALLKYHGQLQDLTSNLISSQEHANRVLARELHDVFSQELAAVSMELSALESNSAKTPQEIQERLKLLGSKIAHLAGEIHGTSRRLHPAILDDLGLEAALREECRGFYERYRVPAEFESKKVPAVIPPAIALCLYRVAQESLRNVGKHAQATRVTVRLFGSRRAITLQIEDEGDGFDLDQALRKGGLGFVSMEERVRLVGGKLDIQSQPSKGTTVTAFVPFKGVP